MVPLTVDRTAMPDIGYGNQYDVILDRVDGAIITNADTIGVG
jgi:hypothetical protein